ncbi:transcriptional activator FlhC [Caballeronia arvi]|uniref:Transcriptional activator FlhC n=1 Tax=Caballeronia arvi TaxID=1777135 RepID=A0A158KU67_9BURK|nr:FlhC family transcriptional regulator [Caballeronia arvi]SAL84678.1 transcriptional activator FlhC [Caballeronia arvi]
MSTNTLDAVETTISLPKFIAEKIQRANYALTDVIHNVLVRYREAENFFGVSRDNMDTFKAHALPKAMLMNMPFLALAPALQDPRDWETFVDDVLLSPTVEELIKAMPAVDALTARDIFHYNCTYVSLLKDVLHMSVLAAPLLGISFKLAEYLMELPIGRLEAAIGAITFPLFRWRFDEQLFWTEYSAGWLTHESVAHYLMSTSNLKSTALPYTHLWSDLRLDRAQRDVYARMLMTQGVRASTATNLFGLNQTRARNTYKQIHGVSSPCGCNPSSLTWYVDYPAHRLQGTLLVWLYRCALENKASNPEALIAANDIVAKMFGEKLVITADRANHLTRSMAMDSRLTMAPCRSCGTDYILSNGEGKIELAKDFVCPGCSYAFKPRFDLRKKKGRTKA